MILIDITFELYESKHAAAFFSLFCVVCGFQNIVITLLCKIR